MRASVVRQLIRKDCRLQRQGILFTMLGGSIALAVVQFGGEVPMVVGAIWFFVSLILVGTMLPLTGIVNERKKQHLAFLMSLPVSSIQYTKAKLLSTLLMFLVPWLTLLAGALLLVVTRGIVPRGAIPIVFILALMPFVGMCLITATALVGESEGWGIAANVFCNSSYGLVWYLLSRSPALMANAKEPVAVWNSAVLRVLGVEVGLILLILGLTFYLQSRKRDFV